MNPSESRLFRHLLAAAAVLASLALSGCGNSNNFVAGNAARPSSYFGWGSGWGGNRNWGGGWGASGIEGGVGGQ